MSAYEPHGTPLGESDGSYLWHGKSSKYGSEIPCGCKAGLVCLLGLGVFRAYSACCPYCALWAHTLSTKPIWCHCSFDRFTKSKKTSISTLFATDSIHWYMLQWQPLTPLPNACIWHDITHTDIATREYLTLVLKRILLIPVHDPIVVLVWALNLITQSVTCRVALGYHFRHILYMSMMAIGV